MSDTPLDPSDIDTHRAQFRERLAALRSIHELKALADEYLGRKSGKVTALMAKLRELPREAKGEFGALINTLKQELEASLASKREALESTQMPAGAVDVTLPGRALPLGRVHPLMQVRQQVEDIFARMGYEILEGPEVEDDYHNFEALNMPQDHPARDMQDTLYLAAPVRSSVGTPATLLRTHTSGMQIRYMEQHQPPVRLIAPGRVYRRDGLDLTHSPMFSQIEGLVVGERVTLADLKGTLVAFALELFGLDRQTRVRPSFFPYTEPSAEVDISCGSCGGTGINCGMCKRTGWLEILGSGMVHPAVFEAVGYDPERYTGFAFGLGIERVAMLRYGIPNIRLLFENDPRMLAQF